MANDIDSIVERAYQRQLDEYLKRMFPPSYGLFLGNEPMEFQNDENLFDTEVDADEYKENFIKGLKLDEKDETQKSIKNFFRNKIKICKL